MTRFCPCRRHPPENGRPLGPKLVCYWPLRTYFCHFFQCLRLPLGDILLHWTLSCVGVGSGVTVTGGPGSQPRADGCRVDPPQSALCGARRMLSASPSGRGRQGPGSGAVSWTSPGGLVWGTEKLRAEGWTGRHAQDRRCRERQTHRYRERDGDRGT